jgi:hypothetical protein
LPYVDDRLVGGLFDPVLPREIFDNGGWLPGAVLE